MYNVYQVPRPEERDKGVNEYSDSLVHMMKRIELETANIERGKNFSVLDLNLLLQYIVNSGHEKQYSVYNVVIWTKNNSRKSTSMHINI